MVQNRTVDRSGVCDTTLNSEPFNSLHPLLRQQEPLKLLLHALTVTGPKRSRLQGSFVLIWLRLISPGLGVDYDKKGA